MEDPTTTLLTPVDQFHKASGIFSKDSDTFVMSLKSGSAVTASSVVIMNTTAEESRIESAPNGSLSYAASISVGVVFGLIGLAAVLLAGVLLQRRLKLCQHVGYRKHNRGSSHPVTYTCIENGNYIGPHCVSAEKSIPTTDTLHVIEQSQKQVTSSVAHSVDATQPDTIQLLQQSFAISLNDTDELEVEERKESDSIVDHDIDDLDQPVFLDVDAHPCSHLDPAASEHGQFMCADGYSSVDDQGESNHLLHSCSDNADLTRPLHEYDPVYVPRHDAASMARRVDESSYVRTPRMHLSDDERSHTQRSRRQLPAAVTVVLPAEDGPAPAAPPRLASAGHVATAVRERRALPELHVAINDFTATHDSSENSRLPAGQFDVVLADNEVVDG